MCFTGPAALPCQAQQLHVSRYSPPLSYGKLITHSPRLHSMAIMSSCLSLELAGLSRQVVFTMKELLWSSHRSSRRLPPEETAAAQQQHSNMARAWPCSPCLSTMMLLQQSSIAAQNGKPYISCRVTALQFRGPACCLGSSLCRGSLAEAIARRPTSEMCVPMPTSADAVTALTECVHAGLDSKPRSWHASVKFSLASSMSLSGRHHPPSISNRCHLTIKFSGLCNANVAWL